MSYDSKEYSVQDGAPIELYAFVSEGAGLEYFYTNNETAITYSGDLYTPIHIERDTIDINAIIVSPATYDFKLPRASDLGEQYGMPFAPPSLFVRVWRRHEDDTEYKKVYFGKSDSFVIAESTITVQTKPVIESMVHRTIGAQTYNGKCNHHFLDERCGLDRGDFTWETSVTSIAGQNITVGNDFNDDNKLIFGDCIINGEYRFILSNVANVIRVRYPFTIASPGDAVTLVAGCRRTKPACDEYDNYLRFGGFALAPKTNPIKTATKPSLFTNKNPIITK